MSRYPDARVITLTRADLRTLTILERARASAIVGVGESELEVLIEAVLRREGSAESIAKGAELFYAFALQLERRIDRSLTWEEAQSWDVRIDWAIDDPVADAEAVASVEAAIATGLPPAVAGELTLAQLDAYRAHSDEIGKRRRRRRKSA
jgi:hypothetical protein